MTGRILNLCGDDLSTSMAAWLAALHKAVLEELGRDDADLIVDLVLQETRRKADELTKPKRPALRVVPSKGG